MTESTVEYAAENYAPVHPSAILGLEDPAESGAHAARHHNADVYHYAACMLLEKLYDRVMSEVVPALSHEQAVWHPSGFMVFRLGSDTTMGAVRLHVWNKDHRQREDRGRGWLEAEAVYDGDIHDHGWYVAGLNIAGYRDNIYKVVRYKGDESHRQSRGDFKEQDIVKHGLYRVFTVDYKQDGADLRIGLSPRASACQFDEESGTDIAHYSGYTVSIDETRVLLPGDVHVIDPHEFHAPTIPDGQFAATLALNSNRVSSGSYAGGKEFATGEVHVLIGGERNEYFRPRQAVTAEEWDEARRQLLAHAF